MCTPTAAENPVLFLIAGLLILFGLTSCDSGSSSTEERDPENKNPEYQVAAYIWPSCHHDERFGDMLWPDGTGEWEIIKKGTPRFKGHFHPFSIRPKRIVMIIRIRRI